MGGHVAERLIIGKDNVTSGCSGDLQGATQLAQGAVRYYGMFGDNVSYISKNKNETSDDYNSMVDKEVQKILDESFERVTQLLMQKDKQLKELSKQLYLNDYLDADQMERIISGRPMDPEKTKNVRTWDSEEYLIKF